jgi:protoporphyrinogen oxidase
VPENPDSKGDKQQANFMTRFYQDAVRDHDNRALWFHPAKGSGQIVERLESEIRSMGGEIYYESEVTHIGTSGDTITTVTVRYGRETITYEPGMVISSLPLEAMAKVMNIAFTPAARELSFKRSVVMIYLFLDKEVAFPHNCIQISSPELNMARITNYSAFGGSMVPDGKGCICIEFFCLEQSGFFAMNDEELYKVALAECEKAQLISRSDCFDYLVFKSPGADPATSWEDYVNDESRAQLYKVLEGYANLFQISRTGIDKSTYAGLLAAKAIVSEDKREFTALTRPDIFTSWQANVS